MNAEVKSLGYVVIGATDLDAWQAFATDLLGMMAAERTADRLLLRMDEYTYRLDIRAAAEDSVLAMGWDCGNAANLAEIAMRLEQSGYAITRADADEARARQVDELVRLRDLDDNFDIELFWGLRNATERFVSPTGVTFVTGVQGIGHAFQAVTDEDAYRRLYFDTLGFKLSDHIDFPGGAVGVFMHCNPRHHSLAVGAVPGRKIGIGHLMFQVTDLDSIGRAYDKVLDGAAPLYSTLGKHTNDKMVSFYCGAPSGLGIEYGHGAIEIDDDVWTPTRYDAAHYWGHRRQPARVEAESTN